MLTLIGWLAAGAAVGLVVRTLALDRHHLGITRAGALGAAGAILGGLVGSALLGPADPSGNRALTVWLVSMIGAGLVPWMDLAYGTRWEAPAAGHSQKGLGTAGVPIRPQASVVTNPPGHGPTARLSLPRVPQ